MSTFDTPHSASPLSFSFPLYTSFSEHERERLLASLRALPFSEFAAKVALLLQRMGYPDVHLMGATHSRGRNRYGGFDLQAGSSTGEAFPLLIAQVKQYRDSVPRTFVDELRGAMLRTGARQGLLVTTSTFSRSAAEAAQSANDRLPVRLVAQEELLNLLTRYGLLDAPRCQSPLPVTQAASPEDLPHASAPADLIGAGERTSILPVPPSASAKAEAQAKGTAPRVTILVSVITESKPPQRGRGGKEESR